MDLDGDWWDLLHEIFSEMLEILIETLEWRHAVPGRLMPKLRSNLSKTPLHVRFGLARRLFRSLEIILRQIF